MPSPVALAMRRSRIAFTVYIICFVASAFLAAAKVGPLYWLPLAIIAIVALVTRLGYQAQIRKGIESGP